MRRTSTTFFRKTTTHRHRSNNANMDKEARGDVGLQKKQMKLMVKSDLQLHQRMRLLESAVLVTQTIKTDNGIPIALKTDGTTYCTTT